MKKLKKTSIFLALLSLIASGCAELDQEETSNKMNDETLNGNAMDSYNDELMDGQVGYVRFQKEQLDQKVEQNRSVKVNKEEIADMITRMILRYDGFDDVGTIVTDNEVLVAYQAPENHERKEAADIVQRTAYSLVPSFYHVYVSDKPSAFGDIQSLSTSTVYDQEYNHVIESIIKKMKEAPQGKIPQDDETMNQ